MESSYLGNGKKLSSLIQKKLTMKKLNWKEKIKGPKQKVESLSCPHLSPQCLKEKRAQYLSSVEIPSSLF